MRLMLVHVTPLNYVRKFLLKAPDVSEMHFYIQILM